MALIWNLSLIPFTDANGNPEVGATAEFFDANTTTPRVVYSDASLSIPSDQPVVANASGIWPAIYLPTGDYRFRLTFSDRVDDVDNVTAPIIVNPPVNDSTTEDQYLFQTGFIMFRWSVSAITGFVRGNGRTIGDAVSGATERANADCEDLFLFLWDADTTLAVGGGRGVNAASDWAASKTIALPFPNGRALAAMSGMGNSPIGLVPDALIDEDGETADTMGATTGGSEHTISMGEMPDHDHGGDTSEEDAHSHEIPDLYRNGYVTQNGLAGSTAFDFTFNPGSKVANKSTTGVAGHHHTIEPQGNGESFSVMQPTIFIPFYIKL